MPILQLPVSVTGNVISHDCWFLDRIATHMLAFEGDSHVEWFEGNYEEYEADRKRLLGADADQPHRIKYRRIDAYDFRGLSSPDPLLQARLRGATAGVHGSVQRFAKEETFMELWELIARESIRDLVARYNANGDSGRFDPMLELFAEDAVMEVPGKICRGKQEIRAMFQDSADRTGDVPTSKASYIRHLTATHQIDLESETEARGRCYYAVLTDQGLDHWGRYVDRYHKAGGRWLFGHRKVSLDGAVEGGWGAS